MTRLFSSSSSMRTISNTTMMMKMKMKKLSSPTSIILLLLVQLVSLSFLPTTTTNVLVVNAFGSSGLQSGPSSGSFYAGGMVFDKDYETLYMTGIHYNQDILDFDDDQANDVSLFGAGEQTKNSSCFVASIVFSYFDDGAMFDDSFEDFFNTSGSKLNTDGDLIQESCTALTVHKANSISQLIVMGTKETRIYNEASIPVEGTMTILDENNLNSLLDKITLVDKDEPTTQFVYPVAVTTDKFNDDYIYFASLTSIDSIENTVESQKKYPDWLKHQHYGSSFDFHVTKLKISEVSDVDVDADEEEFDGISAGSGTTSTTLSKEWTTEFPLDPSSDNPQPRVYIGGIIHKKTSLTTDDSLLIVVGSTRGTGPGYGLAEGDDEDGFVTVIDPITGDFLGDGVREGSAKDDIVTGICDDVDDPDHFFIVGATEGDIGLQQADFTTIIRDNPGMAVPTQSLQPFIRQVKTDRSSSDDDNLWTLQWAILNKDDNDGSKSGFGSAMGCVVDGDYIYVTGTVDMGASIVQGSIIKPSQGGDDVFITKINKTTQSVEWMTQLGSTGNDRVARYGGITIDNRGNPIIYGDTTGSMFRTRSANEDTGNDANEIVEDMFVMSLDEATGTIFEDSNFVGGTSNDRVAVAVAVGAVGDEPTFGPTTIDVDDDEIIDEPTFAPTVIDDVPVDTPEDKTGDPTGAPTDMVFEDDRFDDEFDGDDDIKNEHFYNPIGLQISGPAYAGGIVYDSYDNTVLLAGATYMDASFGLNPTSLCFTGVVNLDDGNLITRTPRGSPDLEEACNAITFDTNRNAAYTVGVAEMDDQGEFGTGGDSWVQGESNAESGGLILQLNANVELLGGNHIVTYPAVYPVSVVTHPFDKDSLFVASMATKRTEINDEYTASGNSYPNFIDPVNRKYGSDFFLMINKYKVNNVPKRTAPAVLENDEVPNTLDDTWFVDFRVDTDVGLDVGGMVMAGSGNVLVVVGSTRGQGGIFEVNDNNGVADMDGFVLKVNPEDGSLLVPSGGSKSSTRLDSINKKDDWILNVCNDRFDHDAFYVVGKTMGKIRDIPDDQQPPEGSVHAYVAKVDLKTLGALWLKHFTMTLPSGGPVEAEALACTVTPDSNGLNVVYVGGTIKDGAEMDGQGNNGEKSYGKDDIFVASMDGGTGEVNWIQQMGTSENDHFACGQGLDVDSFGNAIVYAETGGNFYDQHEGNPDAPDLVVMTVNKLDGSFLSPAIQGEGVGNDNPVDNPPDMVGDGGGVVPDSIVAIQSNYDAPSYAGGMTYDPYTNALYVTGATYVSSKTSQCFFAVATLPRLNFKQEEIYGTNRTPEACSAIALTNYNGKSEAIIVGSSEKSGFMDDLRTARRATQYGMILDLASNGGTYELVGGAVIDDEKVQYPIQVITNDNEQVFVVSLASRDDKVSADFEKADSKKYPNFTTGGVEKYGTKYEILVERHTINRADDMPPGSIDSSMNLDWRKPLETADQKSIFVSGMAMVDNGDALIVVGSTLSSSGDGDFDGIMAKVTTANGSFASEGDEARSVAYFSSVTGDDDWISNVCTDPDDGNSFYIVGATGGDMDDSVNKSDSDATVHAVVSKIQTNTLAILWTTQFAVTHSSGSTEKEAASVALGCAVIPGQGRIYVAGNVENGAILEGSTENAGGDDIFVAMLQTDSGDKIWTKQVGSNGDDRIARGGGIESDANGNAVVFGDTNGDFHRVRKNSSAQHSDIFLMVFNQENGANKPSLSKQSSSPNDNADETASSPVEWFGPKGFDNKKSMSPKLLYSVISALVILLSAVFICCCIRYRTKKRADINKKNSIFTYLQQFAVEDIDLRKSPPGGWHGTYLNKLSHGVNTAAEVVETYKDEEDDDVKLFESAKMVQSSVATPPDSLFTDNTSTPALGSDCKDEPDYAVGDEGDDILKTRSDNNDQNGKKASFSIV
jgi:hypothetical protein